MATWLTLQEYSNKLGLSISTLRRKIKSEEIEHIFKNGRYLLKTPVKEEQLDSIKGLKKYYEGLLTKKAADIQRLREDREDLLQLVNCLEKQKIELLERLNNQNSLSF